MDVVEQTGISWTNARDVVMTVESVDMLNDEVTNPVEIWS